MSTNRLRAELNELRRGDKILQTASRMSHPSSASMLEVMRERALGGLEQRLETERSMWRNATEPVSFDEFCILLDGKPMFPRQVNAWDLSRTLRASHIFDPSRSIRQWLLIWGKRCVAGSTRLRDEATGETRTIKEWAQLRCPLLLRTYDEASPLHAGIAQASAAFRKGRGEIFSVTLESGRNFRATAHHRCRSLHGYIAVSAMDIGSVVMVADDAGAVGFEKVVDIAFDGVEDFYDLTVFGTGCYFDAGGICHSNSGKDYLSAKYICYLAYVLLHFAVDPCTWMSEQVLPSGKKLDLAPRTRIDIVNVAPDQNLARQVFFEYVKKFLSSDLFAPFDIYPKPREWKPGTDHIVFPTVDTHLYSKTSKASSIDGYNLFAGILDEADDFYDSADKSNAATIYRVYKNTAAATFGPFSSVFVISYPRTEDGFVLRLKRRADKRPDIFYVDLAGTQDVRPNFDIMDATIQEEFEEDPDAANAMYRCQLMAAVNTFFKNAAMTLECSDDSRPHCARVSEPEIISADAWNAAKGEMESKKYVMAELESIEPMPGCQYFLTVDGGLSGDAYVICVGHTDASGDAALWLCGECGSIPEVRMGGHYEQLLRAVSIGDGSCWCGICYRTPFQVSPLFGNQGWWKRQEQQAQGIQIAGQTFTLPHVYEDLIIEVKGQRPNRMARDYVEVGFPQLQELILGLMSGLSVVRARVDPWQLVQMVQTLQQAGYDAEALPFSNTAQLLRARLAKIYLSNYLLTLRPNERRDKEWRQLQRKGSSVDHPEGGSKDIYDTEAMLIYAAATHHCQGLDVFLGQSGADTAARQREPIDVA